VLLPDPADVDLIPLMTGDSKPIVETPPRLANGEPGPAAPQLRNAAHVSEQSGAWAGSASGSVRYTFRRWLLVIWR
jgi:hypothetical protein